MFPEPKKNLLNERIEKAVDRLRSTVLAGRAAREEEPAISLKRPLKEAIILCPAGECQNDIQSFVDYITSELNVNNCRITSDESLLELKCEADQARLGKRLRSDASKVRMALAQMPAADIQKLLHDDNLVVCGHKLSVEDVKLERVFKVSGGGNYRYSQAADIIVALDVAQNDKLNEQWYCREFINRIQKLRKRALLQPTDHVEAYYHSNSSSLNAVFVSNRQAIEKVTKISALQRSEPQRYVPTIVSEHTTIGGSKLQVWLQPRIVHCDLDAVANMLPANSSSDERRLFAQSVQEYLATRKQDLLRTTLQRDGVLQIHLDGHTVELQLNKQVFA